MRTTPPARGQQTRVPYLRPGRAGLPMERTSVALQRSGGDTLRECGQHRRGRQSLWRPDVGSQQRRARRRSGEQTLRSGCRRHPLAAARCNSQRWARRVPRRDPHPAREHGRRPAAGRKRGVFRRGAQRSVHGTVLFLPRALTSYQTQLVSTPNPEEPMRVPGIILTASLLLGSAPLAAQQFGPTPDTATRREILTLREAAWRTWFANDRAGFERIVPEELVALGWDGGDWQDRGATLAAMREFVGSGLKLITLEFPRNVFQQYGDVVILYTRFRLVLTDTAGRARETNGRGTEVFVRRRGRWIHTAWHLDQVAN